MCKVHKTREKVNYSAIHPAYLTKEHFTTEYVSIFNFPVPGQRAVLFLLINFKKKVKPC
jgi:hypothetical protein